MCGFPIIFLVNEYYRNLVEECGFGFRSTGTIKQHIDFHSDVRIWDPASDIVELGFEAFIKQAIEASFRHVIELNEKMHALAVISTYPTFNGATMAADALSIPHITVALSPRYIPSHVAPPAPLKWLLPNWVPLAIKKSVFKAISYASARRLMRKAYFRTLNEMRKSYGLSGLTTSQMVGSFSESHLNIATFPGWYGLRASDWPTNLHATGFPEFTQMDHGAQEIADKFIRSYGSPLAFTTGTGIQDATRLFSEGKKICKNLDVPGLFVGKVENRMDYGMKGFLHLDYVDFKFVLPRCRAIVHHGGIGTLAEAVRAAIPQLVRPLAFDQFDNADRVHRLGLGTFVMPKHFHEKKVTPIIRKLISYGGANGIIDKYAALAKDDGAIPKACDLIEKFLSAYEAPRRTFGT